MKKTALVLLSGGQDSATCLAIALKKFPQSVIALAFDYQQRHHIELIYAKKVAKLAQVPLTVLKLPILSQLTSNSLTRHQLTIEKTSDLPNTFVDGRNLLFLSIAAIFAKQHGIKHIYTGVCQTDYSGYPDCREAFIHSLNQTLNLSMDYSFNIVTPLMHLTKKQTVQLMQELNHLDWYAYTHTCYEGKRPACGVCPACQLRLKGFYEAGVLDPLAYVRCPMSDVRRPMSDGLV